MKDLRMEAFINLPEIGGRRHVTNLLGGFSIFMQFECVLYVTEISARFTKLYHQLITKT
jgi:hypothetical protein